MRKVNTIVAVAALMAFAAMGGKVKAQSLSDNGIFYHAFSSPWSSSLNPAMFPETAKWYVSVARTNADISLPFSYNDLNLKYDPVRNATVFNVTDFLQTMADRQCRFSTNADMNLLGVGFSIGSHLHLMLDAGIRSNSTVTLPLELTRILTEGNLNQNRHLDLGTTMLAHYMAYGHVSAGVAYEFTRLPLTLGARVNLLDGLAMASVDKLAVDITTASDTSSLNLSLDYLVHSAGLAFLTINENNKLAFKHKLAFPNNFGVTFDLGMKFKLENFEISASLIDWGPGITWNDSCITLKPKSSDNTIHFEGIEIGRLSDSTYFRQWADSLINMIDYKAERKPFSYTPPTRMFVGLSYSLFNMLKVGYLFHGEWESGWFNHFGEGNFRCNNSLSLNFNLFNWLELTAANSLSYDGKTWSFFNPGMSISVNPGARTQFYVAVDYVSSLMLSEMRAAHIYFGINVYGLR